ncbi:MAG: hypothetical protein IAE67_04065 [Candidatus Competibacteraceae bacterium]|nr:hypothetical protein [Candidatus Competibacteraceae bacterium]
MTAGWGETLLFVLLASVKFAIATPFYILENKLGFGEALLFGISSGAFGILTFMFLSTALLKAWEWLMKKLGFRKHPKPKKIFTKKNRMLVRMKNKYGLPGIALLSPIIISIPVGTFLAVRYFRNKKKVFAFLLGGVIFWSLIFSSSASAIIKIMQKLGIA